MIIVNRNRNYEFLDDRVIVTKKGKVIREVFYNEIEEITYNPKFGIKDLLHIVFLLAIVRTPGGHEYFNKALVFFQKSIKDVLTVKVETKDFEEIKNLFKIPIKIV